MSGGKNEKKNIEYRHRKDEIERIMSSLKERKTLGRDGLPKEGMQIWTESSGEMNVVVV